jgi:hypothetical protein
MCIGPDRSGISASGEANALNGTSRGEKQDENERTSQIAPEIA